MMAQIKDIALDLAEVYSDDYCKDEIEYSCAFEHFQQELEDCFAMHFKADYKPVNVSDEQSITESDLINGIKAIMHKNLNNRLDPFSLKLFQQTAKEVLELLKACRTIHNSDQNNSDDK
jgi:hypothetical protein